MDQTAPTRLLLVDDEPALREPLAEYLSRQGFAVTQAASAAEARSQLKNELPELVLLDIMMPGEDGLSLCRHLADAHQIPTILLTAKGEAMDRIIGLEIGADDYVVKPFEPRELVARIRSVLRRSAKGGSAPAEDEQFEFEGWHLDPLKRRLTDPEGAMVSISSAEFRLLMAFLEHPRQVLDRDRLLDMVQGREAHLFDRAVDNQVSRLRRKIEVDSKAPTLIQTVWGGGYMLATDVRRVKSPEKKRGGGGHRAKVLAGALVAGGARAVAVGKGDQRRTALPRAGRTARGCAGPCCRDPPVCCQSRRPFERAPSSRGTRDCPPAQG